MRRWSRWILFLPLVLFGCGGPDYERLFGERLAREALTCLHPAGEYESAGEVVTEADDAFLGTIYWRGGATGNRYFTRVRVKVTDGQATVFVVEDTSILPAINQDCHFPVAAPASP